MIQSSFGLKTNICARVFQLCQKPGLKKTVNCTPWAGQACSRGHGIKLGERSPCWLSDREWLLATVSCLAVPTSNACCPHHLQSDSFPCLSSFVKKNWLWDEVTWFIDTKGVKRLYEPAWKCDYVGHGGASSLWSDKWHPVAGTVLHTVKGKITASFIYPSVEAHRFHLGTISGRAGLIGLVSRFTVCILEVNKHKNCCLQLTKVTSSSTFTPYPGMRSFDSSPLITACLQLQTSFWHTFASARGATARLFFFKVKRLVKTHHRASGSTPADSSWSRREQLTCVAIDFSNRRRHMGSCSSKPTTTDLVEHNSVCRLVI